MERVIVGISGASGTILARRLIESLPCEIDLVISQGALYTARYELGAEMATTKRFVESFDPEIQRRIYLHAIHDIGSAIASGSHRADAMVIVPCSMATVAAVSCGLGDNALRRAADVTIKEKRPLVLVPRETPLSAIHLENMLKLARLGVTILPPMPGWYTEASLEDFVVGKILDVLKIEHRLYPRWKEPAEEPEHVAAH